MRRGGPKEAAEAPVDLAEMAGGRRVVQISATLSDDVQIPSVRAYMVLSALAELGETLACSPTPDEVETFAGSEIDVWMVSERADSELAARRELRLRRRPCRGLRGRQRRRCGNR